jgi:very-short-patch-repair endonuclease
MSYFELAERQHGVITRAQLLALGSSSSRIQRLVSGHRLALMLPSVYRIVGAPRSAHQRLSALCLLLGNEAVVSHLTAAHLFRLDAPECSTTHVTIGEHNRRGRGVEGVVLHRSRIVPERRVVDGIPTTSAARTIVDVSGHVDAEQLEAMFESARRLGLVTATTLLAKSERAPAVRAMLRRSEGRPLESRLEVKLARMLRKSTLPPSVAQYRIGPYRVDRAWPDRRVAVEADGFRHHGQSLEWKRDRRRVAEIEAHGWRIVHVTWDDVMKEPSQTLDRIALALGILAA